jgi:hypothetical protein
MVNFVASEVNVNNLEALIGDGTNYQIVYHSQPADGSVNLGANVLYFKIKGPGGVGKSLFVRAGAAGVVETPLLDANGEKTGWVKTDLSDPSIKWAWSGKAENVGKPAGSDPQMTLSDWVAAFTSQTPRLTTNIQTLLFSAGSNDLGLKTCTPTGPRPPERPRIPDPDKTVKFGFYLDYLTLRSGSEDEATQINFELGESSVDVAPLAPVINQCKAGDQQITVEFDVDPSKNGDVTNIEYSTDGGTTWTLRSPDSTESPLVLSELTNGTSYSVSIKALAGSSQSEASAESCTVTPFGQASAPTNLIATAGDGLITVDFDPPANTNGDVITHYEYSLNGGSAFISSGSDTPSITVTGLTNGTTYSIMVRARGAVPGQDAGPVTATPLSSSTNPEQPKAPGRPSGVTLAGGNRSLTVSFGTAAANGAAISDYEYSLGGADFKSSGVTTSPFTIGGLTNGQSYTVALRARNAAGVGPATSPVAGTPATVPGVPTNLVATPGDTQAFVAFTAPADNGADILDYEYRIDGGAVVSTGDVTPSITVTGLTNGTSYQIEVRAENSKGSGAWSAATTVTPESGAEPPDAPTITGAFRDNSDIVVEFTAGENNGAEITDYEYRVEPNGPFTSGRVTASPITLEGQDPGDAIRVSVRAVNAEGPGPDSALWLVPAEKPFPPQGNVRAELTLVGSECDIAYAQADSAPAGVGTGLDIELDFALNNCDAGESVSVSIDLGTNLPEGAKVHKVNPDGTFTEITGATYTATTVSYVIEDDQGQGDYIGLDRNPQATVVEDPIVFMVPVSPPPAQPSVPVPIPFWLLAVLMGSVGWLGYRRFK